MILSKAFPPDIVPVVVVCVFLFFNDTATTEIYTLSLHDALPIWPGEVPVERSAHLQCLQGPLRRSEEHTSELQSHDNLVCRLLLEKKQNRQSKLDPIRDEPGHGGRRDQRHVT